jgi:hypothetical protein
MIRNISRSVLRMIVPLVAILALSTPPARATVGASCSTPGGIFECGQGEICGNDGSCVTVGEFSPALGGGASEGAACNTTTDCSGLLVCDNGKCVGDIKPPSPNAPSVGSSTTLQNPLGQGVTIQAVVGRVIRIFTGVSGSLALLMFVYGGFLWLTSSGNAQQVDKGKKVMVWATIGLFIIFGSYAILSTIFSAIGATPSTQ